MAFNGSGVFIRVYNWVQDASANIKIRADRMDTEMNGFATGLSMCVTRDGQSPASANLPMGGFRHTNVSDGVQRNEYLTLGQVQDGEPTWADVAGGTANAITINATPAITTLIAGQEIVFKALLSNTAAVTVSVNGLTALALIKSDGTALVAGDLVINGIYSIRFDGTQFQLNAQQIGINQLSSALFTTYNFRGKNALINSGFQVAQRATSFATPATNTTTLDRWKILYDGTIGAFTISQQAFTPGQTDVPYEPQYFARWAQTSAGSASTFRRLIQRIESVRTFAGQQVTLSFYAKADVARSVVTVLQQNFGTGGSTAVDTAVDTFALTTAWQKFTKTVTLPSIATKTIGVDDYLGLLFNLPINTLMTIDIAQVQLEVGAYATPYDKRTFFAELQDSLRYYEKSYDPFIVPGTTTSSGATRVWARSASDFEGGGVSVFKAAMRTTPTVVFYSITGAINTIRDVSASADRPVVGGATNTNALSFYTTIGGLIAGNLHSWQWTADAEL